MTKKIGIVGPPNCGKSSLFNRLTGLNQKVANYSGVTVDMTEGNFRFSQDTILVDLPGVNYLNIHSQDAKVATEIIKDPTSIGIDYFILIVDSTRLSQQMYLIEQLYQNGTSFILILNIVDSLHLRGGLIDIDFLSKNYECPVFSCSVKKGLGLHKVIQFIRETDPREFKTKERNILSEDEMIKKASTIADKAILKKNQSDKITDRLDAFFLHKFWGTLFLIFLSYIVFQSIFSWFVPIQDGIGNLLDMLASFISSHVKNEFILSLVNDGVIAGVGAVLAFIPQIMILFFYIFLMESTGYMTRASMLVDRFFEVIGLEGRAFFPLFSANACAVPAIMSTRIIPNEKTRFITSLVSPFITCSARLPIYFIVITAFVPDTYYYFISLRTIVYIAIYFISLLTIVVTSKVMSFILKTEPFQNISSQIIDLPAYRLPNIRNLILFIYKRVILFLKKAGKIIFPFSIVLWFLTYFPLGNDINHSYLAIIGQSIQPVFAPIGFDWKITIAILASLAAREVVISTLALIYNVDSASASIITTFHQHLSIAQGFSLLVFFIFALQCISTMAIMKKEFKSWAFPISAFLYMFALAYFFSFITYRIFS